MSTINLAVEEEGKKSYPSFLKNGIVSASVILILMLCLYGGLLYYNKKLVAEIESVHNQYTNEYNNFLAGNANEVIDFKNRSTVAKNLISQSYPIKNIFNQAESSVLPGVYLDSLSYNGDSKTVELNCVTNGFNAEAKQILSFKENENFSSLTLGKSAIDAKTGLVNFTVSLKIK